ncbi:SDR family NAD(P)-dependent oxidoreductase, partial [Mesorhizobium sp.]
MTPNGQIAIVTGGGSGLGEATARALATKGAKIAILDIGIDRAAKVAADIGGIAVQCDVSSADSGSAAIAEVAAKLGEPRILVNCAGIAIGVKTVGKDGPHPLDQYRKVIEINLIGTFNMIRLVADRAAKLDPLAGGERGV